MAKKKDGAELVMVPVAITSKIDGFRRAGRAHAAKRTIWPPGTWTEKQLDQLKAEPILIVEVLPAGETGAKPEETEKE